MKENIVESKSLDFAVKCIELYKHLTFESKEYILSKQMVRSGTSIGANIKEAVRGQSNADFISKMSISLKEASETGYWLELLFKTNYIDEITYKSLSSQCTSIRVMLISSVNTAKENAK